MRWDDLIADLEAQASALVAAERDAEVAERTRIETAQLVLLGRLGPALGAQIRLRCIGNLDIRGRLRHISPEWLLIDDSSGRETLIALSSILMVSGLGRLSAAGESTDQLTSRLGLRYALRGIARDRSAVRLVLIDATTLNGTIDRVGADFIEFAVHAPGELRRRDSVIEVVLVSTSAISALQRAAEDAQG